MFVSKVWGFDNPCGPLVFNSPGMRENSAAKLKAGDRVILVGTKTPETADTDKNRVLGIMEPSQIAVATSDFPLPNPSDKRMFKADGSYRWPVGLLNYKAWQFEPGLFLDAIAPRSDNPFGTPAAAGIVPLTSEEEARVLSHPHHEILLLASVSANLQLFGKSGAKGKGAPVPTDGARRGIMHMRRAPAFVYWFRLVRFDQKIVGHKIGWTFDWERRQQQFNSVSLSRLGGLTYKVREVQKLETARLAYGMEQKLLQSFDQNRHSHNQEVLTGIATAALQEVWDRLVIEALVGKLNTPFG